MTGPVDHAVILQSASLLLQYPDAAWRDRLPVVRNALRALPHGAPRDGLLAFADHGLATPAAELEQHYVETFDRKRRCCLHLTWWTDGETRRRGLSLATLKALYRSHGFDLQGSELPDFLPVVLEFAAQADVAAGLELLQQHRAGIELLRLALLDVASPYAGVVAGICALLPGVSPETQAAARALARTGPPTESVGLELLPFTPMESTGARR
jgi:nitrate reductase molybdenum cofactor assembly chaperone